MRCDDKDHGINLAIPVSGIVHVEFFLFANMNGEDCLLSVVVTCSHDETAALYLSLDSSKWRWLGKSPLVDDIIHKNFSYSFIRNTCPLYYRGHQILVSFCSVDELRCI